MNQTYYPGGYRVIWQENLFWFTLVSILVLILNGCSEFTHNSLLGESIDVKKNPASAMWLSPDGDMKAVSNGTPSSGLSQDSEGTWLTTPGQGAVITFNPLTNTMYVWSPKDTRIEEIEISIDQSTGVSKFTAKTIEANLSTVASVYKEQFAFAMDALKDMTRAEAELHIKRMESLETISRDVADLLRKSFIPTLPEE